MNLERVVSPADDLLVAREGQGLVWSFRARLVFLILSAFFRLFVHVEMLDLVVGLAVSFAGMGLCAWGLHRAKQGRSLALLSVKGVAFDLMILVVAPVLVSSTYPGMSMAVIAKSDIGILGVVFIVINGVSMRPLYPAVITAGAVALQLVALIWLSLSPDAQVSTDMVTVFSSAAIRPGLVVARILILSTVGVGVSFLAAMARRTVRDAVAMERKNQQIREEEAQRINEGKINALGHLIAGIAHEVNSPLGAIRSSAGTVVQATERLSGHPEAAQSARALEALAGSGRAIQQGVERITTLVSSLKVFAHHEHVERAPFDLRTGLDSAWSMVPETVRSGIELVRRYGEVPSIVCDARALNQVFFTLLLNACEAMRGRGQVEVATRWSEGVAIVEIADQGPGISSERLPVLFELSFSDKGQRIGMGLGLPNARHVLSLHGGRIEVESQAGAGTRFRLVIPG